MGIGKRLILRMGRGNLIDPQAQAYLSTDSHLHRGSSNNSQSTQGPTLALDETFRP